MSDFWDLRIGDYIAWLIGLIAMGIAIGIFIRQENVNKKIDSIRKDTISVSVGRINYSLEILYGSIDSTIDFIKSSAGDNEDKLRIARKFLNYEQKFYSTAIENTTKELDFLKGQIDPLVHTQIETIIQLVKKFSSDEMFEIDYGATELLKRWSEFGNDIVQQILEVQKKIEQMQK